MSENKTIPQCCGTCRRWMRDKKKDWKGTCLLDQKERGIDDMSGCMGWKEADPWVLEMRGFSKEA